MNIKEQAYQLQLQGLSYQEIADKLGISKTVAHGHVKEQKLLRRNFFDPSVPNSFKPSKKIRNASEQGLKGNSEQIPNTNSEQIPNITPLKDISLKEPTIPFQKIKVFTGDELIQKTFITLKFDYKFLELIGNPSKKFYAIIWGLPKGGKSCLSVRFADYLQEYQGSVLYCAVEEQESATLQQKFRDIGGSKVTIIETRDREEIRKYLKENDFEFVFIDSINVAGIDSKFLDLLKAENPTKSFIGVCQSTKGGDFKGDQSLTHNCDFVIKVVDGVAYQKGRFNPASEIKIFGEPLYQKNKNRMPEIEKSTNPLEGIDLNKENLKLTDQKIVLKKFESGLNNLMYKAIPAKVKSDKEAGKLDVQMASRIYNAKRECRDNKQLVFDIAQEIAANKIAWKDVAASFKYHYHDTIDDYLNFLSANEKTQFFNILLLTQDEETKFSGKPPAQASLQYNVIQNFCFAVATRGTNIRKSPEIIGNSGITSTVGDSNIVAVATVNQALGMMTGVYKLNKDGRTAFVEFYGSAFDNTSMQIKKVWVAASNIKVIQFHRNNKGVESSVYMETTSFLRINLSRYNSARI